MWLWSFYLGHRHIGVSTWYGGVWSDVGLWAFELSWTGWHIWNLVHLTFWHLERDMDFFVYFSDPLTNQICNECREVHLVWKIVGLKSHNLHCLIEQIIPVCARSLVHPFQQIIMIRLGKCFFTDMFKDGISSWIAQAQTFCDWNSVHVGDFVSPASTLQPVRPLKGRYWE